MEHIQQDELISFYYGDPEFQETAKKEAVSRHLSDCAECASAYQQLERILAAVNEKTIAVPERDESYGEQVWARVRTQLPEKHKSFWADLFSSAFRPQKLILAGGLAVILVVAFLVGRMTKPMPPAPSTTVAEKEKVKEHVILVAVGDHLEKSQMMLIELANAEPGKGGIDISTEQERARDLLDANRLYKQSARQIGEPAVTHVLDQLERVLVEVANSPSELTPAQLQQIQDQIQSQGLLFKVRVLGSKVRNENQKSREGAGAGSAQRKT